MAKRHDRWIRETWCFDRDDLADYAERVGSGRSLGYQAFDALFFFARRDEKDTWLERRLNRRSRRQPRVRFYCDQYYCTWRANCRGRHWVWISTFRAFRIVAVELLADRKRRPSSGETWPRFTLRRIELLRQYKRYLRRRAATDQRCRPRRAA
jgi:hypothetical protein